jgi:lipoate-protein ligase B
MSNQTENPAKTLDIIDLEIIDYQQTLDLQLDYVEKRRQNQIPDTIFLLEHKPVITLGARKTNNKLLTTPEILEQKNIDLVEIRRGGGSTAHNPGQLVIYPILNLRLRNMGPNEYVRTLETIGIELLAQFSINAQRKKGFPGLWCDNDKIASIGVRISRQISRHGIAINFNNDLTIFDHMIPCGIENIKMTSVKEITKKQTPMKNVKTAAEIILKKYFEQKDEK